MSYQDRPTNDGFEQVEEINPVPLRKNSILKLVRLEDTSTHKMLRDLEEKSIETRISREEIKKNRPYSFFIFAMCAAGIGAINYFRSQTQEKAPGIEYSLNQINR